MATQAAHRTRACADPAAKGPGEASRPSRGRDAEIPTGRTHPVALAAARCRQGEAPPAASPSGRRTAPASHGRPVRRAGSSERTDQAAAHHRPVPAHRACRGTRTAARTIATGALHGSAQAWPGAQSRPGQWSAAGPTPQTIADQAGGVRGPGASRARAQPGPRRRALAASPAKKILRPSGALHGSAPKREDGGIRTGQSGDSPAAQGQPALSRSAPALRWPAPAPARTRLGTQRHQLRGAPPASWPDRTAVGGAEGEVQAPAPSARDRVASEEAAQRSRREASPHEGGQATGERSRQRPGGAAGDSAASRRSGPATAARGDPRAGQAVAMGHAVGCGADRRRPLLVRGGRNLLGRRGSWGLCGGMRGGAASGQQPRPGRGTGT